MKLNQRRKKTGTTATTMDSTENMITVTDVETKEVRLRECKSWEHLIPVDLRAV